MVLTQWFDLGSSVSVVKKLCSISPFVKKVPFVALKLIVSNSLCMITWFQLVFSEIPPCKYCLIYKCALFCHFSGSIFTKKDSIQENKFMSRWYMTSGCKLQLQFNEICMKTNMNSKRYYVENIISWNTEQYIGTMNKYDIFIWELEFKKVCSY